MIAGRRHVALLLAAALGCASASAALVAAAAAPGAREPIKPAAANLLIANKYEVRIDGSVVGPSGDPVEPAELPGLVSRLKSSQRLKALLKLDLILSGSAGEKYLTPAERESVRSVLRDNWPYFTRTTRKHFKMYFTLEELEKLNRTPPDDEAEAAVSMRDPEIEAVAPEPEAAPKPAAVTPATPLPMPADAVGLPPSQPVPAPAPAPAPTVAVVPPASVPGLGAPAKNQLSPGLSSPATQAPAPATVPAATPAPPQQASVTPATPLPKPAGAVGLPPSQPATVAAAVAAAMPAVMQPAPVREAAKAAAFGGMNVVGAPAPAAAPKAGAPIPAPAGPAATPSPKPPDTLAPAGPNAVPFPPKPVLAPEPKPEPKPAPAAPKLEPLPAPPAPAAIRAVSSGEFEKFLAEAPYNRDIKTLLRIIADKADEPARSRALSFVIAAMPGIYIDAERAGLATRVAVESQEAADGQRAVSISLNPAVVLVKRKRMFFGDQVALVPDSSAAYARLKLSPPAALALKRDATAAKVERSAWGDSRSFEDDSERAVFTPSESAGSLFWGLLTAEAKRAGWDASPYAAEVVARSAQMRLYHRLATEAGDDAFLDPELRPLYRQWRDRPSEFRDFLVHTLSAGRMNALDPAAPGVAEHERAARKAYESCPDSLTAENAREAAASAEALKKSALGLAKARLVDAGAFDEALKALDAEAAARKPAPVSLETCARRFRHAVEGLRQAQLLLDETAAEERARLEKASIDHAK